ncbi:DUF3131 domain-containing protein [PVC group bacterium]|nr:DUF3131 domain-containing protein [PVC group bacterium]
MTFRFVRNIFFLLIILFLSASCGHNKREETTAQDDSFLNEFERRCFLFFWEEANPENGLIVDSAKADGRGSDSNSVASIASVGFGLSGICIAEERGWITHADAYARVLTTLKYIWEDLPNEHGFFYHFLNIKTGKRAWKCEVSSIDTALLMAGVLTVRQYYKNTEIAELATKIYERVDWPWMLNGGRRLSMGWKPESGFLETHWDWYSEHMLLYLLAIGSPTHPIDAKIWQEWKRAPVGTFAGKTYLQCPPLFTHQFSPAWIDFRNKRDAFADYWQNSVLATLAQREYCASLSDKFPHYSLKLWGLTSADGSEGYKAWGGPPEPADPKINGTIVPCASAGSMPFVPKVCREALEYMHAEYGDKIWKRYGFVDAFNPHTGWTSSIVIGIDVGISLLMIENERSGIVWKNFMQNPEISAAMLKCGFVNTDMRLSADDREYLKKLARDTWRSIVSMENRKTGLPYDNSEKNPNTSVSNIGVYLSDIVAAEAMGLIKRGDAEERIEKTLVSLAKLKTTYGFQQSWNNVETLRQATNDTWISVLDSGNLVGGLITVGQAFPRFEEQCTDLVMAMDWNAFYNTEKKLLCGGYNNETEKFNMNWLLPFMGSDSRMASFFSIATEKVPAGSWDAFDRKTEERHLAHFLLPGWKRGGGIFEQYLPGLWLDEKDTFMGQSAANFAYAQIRQAQIGNYPVWGWSASESPLDGYLGMGALRDNIVTPHASVLAIRDYPQEVIKNLHALDKLGARSKEYGYMDAIDFKTGKTAETFLMLDQSMLFMSLANFLQDGIIRKHFESSPLVKRGRQLIGDYRNPSYGENISVSGALK